MGTLVTYVIDRENVELQVSSVPDSSQPYKTRTEKNNKYLDNPAGGDNVRIYVLPDGQEFRRNWEGVALVEKHVTEPAPTPTPAPQSGSTSSGGGKSNLFEKCTIC